MVDSGLTLTEVCRQGTTGSCCKRAESRKGLGLRCGGSFWGGVDPFQGDGDKARFSGSVTEGLTRECGCRVDSLFVTPERETVGVVVGGEGDPTLSTEDDGCSGTRSSVGGLGDTGQRECRHYRMEWFSVVVSGVSGRDRRKVGTLGISGHRVRGVDVAPTREGWGSDLGSRSSGSVTRGTRSVGLGTVTGSGRTWDSLGTDSHTGIPPTGVQEPGSRRTPPVLNHSPFVRNGVWSGFTDLRPE